MQRRTQYFFCAFKFSLWFHFGEIINSTDNVLTTFAIAFHELCQWKIYAIIRTIDKMQCITCMFFEVTVIIKRNISHRERN